MVVSARTIGELQEDLPESEHRQVNLEGSTDMRVSVALLCV